MVKKLNRHSLRPTSKHIIESLPDQQFFPLIFNVCVAGQYSSPLSENGNMLIKGLFSDLVEVVKPYRNHKYGFSETDISYRILHSSINCNIPLESLLPDIFSFYNVHPQISSEQKSRENFFHRTTPIPLNLPDTIDANSYHELINWLMEQSDLFITYWDGSKEFNGGLIWNAILQVQKKNIPIIWLNPSSPDQLYLYNNGKNIPYKKSYLSEYCHELLGLGRSQEKLNELKNLLGSANAHNEWFSKYYGNFIRRFNIPAAPTSKDDLLEVNTQLPEALNTYEDCFLQLKSAYKKADEIAIIENNNYRSALYLKALLPFIVNCILIFGFYAKTIGFILPFEPWLWDIIITVSFGFQFACQLFIIRVSDQNNRKGWQKKFIDHRYLAEVLRLAIHFLPLNLPLNNNSSSIFANNLPKDSPVSHRIRAILRITSINSSRFSSEEEREFFFSNTDKLIKHQKDYQEYSAKKYEIINQRLTKIAWTLFYAGLFVIFLRVLLQIFYLSIDVNWISITLLKPQRDAIQAFCNLLALLVPSSGVTVFTIMNVCDFGNLSRRCQQMVGNLAHLKERLDNERLVKNLTYDDYCRLAKQISTLLLQETTDWYALINTKKITKN